MTRDSREEGAEEGRVEDDSRVVGPADPEARGNRGGAEAVAWEVPEGPEDLAERAAPVDRADLEGLARARVADSSSRTWASASAMAICTLPM